jgi:hypothetical protein
MPQITVLKANKTKPEGKNYTVVELAYKTEDGKTKGMKLFGFGAQKENAEVAANAQPGDVLDAVFQQNQKGYWEFASLKSTGNKVAETGPQVNSTTVSTSKGSWETSEERAARQVMIVRQSSLSTAVAFLEAAKVKPGVADVIEAAKEFESYVLGNEKKKTPTGDVA